MTDEDRAKESADRKARWDKMSAEEQQQSLYTLHEEWNKWYNGLSPEELKAYRDSLHAFWRDMTKEQFIEWLNKQNEGFTEYYRSMGGPENISELAFSADLRNLNIDYEWQYLSTNIHPDFDKIFAHNPVLDRRVSPFHRWDFLVKTRNGRFLVDIDGSMHNIKLGEYVTADGIDIGKLKMFQDSMRPYQTDGMDAFIIQAYDDQITNDTKVFQIDRKRMKIIYAKRYKDFLTMIRFLNFNDKQMKDVVK